MMCFPNPVTDSGKARSILDYETDRQLLEGLKEAVVVNVDTTGTSSSSSTTATAPLFSSSSSSPSTGGGGSSTPHHHHHCRFWILMLIGCYKIMIQKRHRFNL